MKSRHFAVISPEQSVCKWLTISVAWFDARPNRCLYTGVKSTCHHSTVVIIPLPRLSRCSVVERLPGMRGIKVIDPRAPQILDIKSDSDSSTAKRSATGVSVTGRH